MTVLIVTLSVLAAFACGALVGRRFVARERGALASPTRTRQSNTGQSSTGQPSPGQPGAGKSNSGRPSTDQSSTDHVARAVIERMSAAAFVVDTADRVFLANSVARNWRLVRGDRVVVRQLLAMVREVSVDGEAWSEIVVTAERGQAKALHAHGFRIDDDLVGIVLVDVSESHRVEAVRRDFVANVSHELKTPVGAITLLGEAIEDAADDQAAVRRFAMSMQKESKRLSLLVQELIELSRLQGGEQSPPSSVVSIAAVVAECADRARTAAAAKDIKIQTAGDADLHVVGVERHFVMALTNLLTNAVSYSPESTTVAVTYRAVGEDAEIVVKDQGIGIATADLKRIFERFYRVDRARSRQTGGTGLGLAIVKHIVNNHGGTISVWSAEGHGSTFTMRVPRTPHADERPATDHSLVSDTAIDDDPPAGDVTRDTAAGAAPETALDTAPDSANVAVGTTRPSAPPRAG